MLQEDIRRYFETGDFCPYCGAADTFVSWGSPVYDDNSCWSQPTCDRCGRSWKEYFILSKIELDTGESHVDPMGPWTDPFNP